MATNTQTVHLLTNNGIVGKEQVPLNDCHWHEFVGLTNSLNTTQNQLAVAHVNVAEGVRVAAAFHDNVLPQSLQFAAQAPHSDVVALLQADHRHFHR